MTDNEINEQKKFFGFLTNFRNKRLLYLLILLGCVALDESANNTILGTLAEQVGWWGVILPLGMMVIQIIAAPIQAAHSDHYCRRKTLRFSLLFTTLSLIFLAIFTEHRLHWIFLLSPLLLKALIGNTFPIALAGLAVTQTHSFMFSVGLSTSAMAIGYIGLKTLSNYIETIYIILTLVALLVFINFFARKLSFDDTPKSLEEKKEKEHPSSILEDLASYPKYLKSRILRGLLTTFSFWEYSFYLVFILDVDLNPTLSSSKNHISDLSSIGES